MRVLAIGLAIGLVIMVIACKTSNQGLKVEHDEQSIQSAETSNITTGREIDTLHWYSSSSLSKDSIPTNTYFLFQDQLGRFHFVEQGKSVERRKEILHDSIGIRSAAFLTSDEEVERFDVYYDNNGHIAEVKRYQSHYDQLKLKSIERYRYKNQLLKTFEFVDMIRLTRDHVDSVSIVMNHVYDSGDRLDTTFIKKRNGQLRYFSADTVSYSYKGSETLPFRVQKTAFAGTEYLMTQKSKSEQEFIKIHKEKYKEDIAVLKTTKQLKFDELDRVVEYKIIRDHFIPEDLTEIKYEKHVYTYSEDVNLKRIPKLLFRRGQHNVVPDPDFLQHFTSNIEISGYPDVEVRTDLGFFELPKSITTFTSRNGKDWVVKSKYDIE